MNKHAYLIIAYNQWNLLEKLIHLLDDERNDIYIHINQLIKNVPFDRLKKSVMYSNLCFVERVPIKRGTYSIFDAEMNLIKTACRGGTEYSYLHLLSGQDLPLKDQDSIHRFFFEHSGKNFIDVIPPEKIKEDWYQRSSLYQFLVPYTLGKSFESKIAKGIRKLALAVQKTIGINRFRRFEDEGYRMCYGSSWFSITEDFARFIIRNEKKIKEMYEKHTYIPEESILQTFLWSSEYKNTLYDDDWLDNKLNRANLRLIFWSGNTSPDTITMDHIDELLHTRNLFARKFDIEKYPDVIDRVVEMASKRLEEHT